MPTWPLFRPDFRALAYLRPEVLLPEVIGRRTCALVDRLAHVHPLLTDWVWGEWEGDDGDVVETPFAIIRQDLTAAINRKKKIPLGVEGPWMQDLDGYFFSLFNDPPQEPQQSVSVSVSAGGRDCNNRVSVKTSDRGLTDPALLTFDVMRAATLALCESFRAMFCNVFQGSIKTLPDLPGRCMLGAMNYIGPAGAALVTPPSGVFAERRPDGGLLMVATRDRFDPENPAHVAAACTIHEALAPYNALPEPF